MDRHQSRAQYADFATAPGHSLAVTEQASRSTSHALFHPVCAYSVRMPSINVYLPAELHEAVKAEDLPVSEICKRALRRELARVRRRRTTTTTTGGASNGVTDRSS